MPQNKSELPVIAACEGCGVCCFHMGYPAYILPREPMTHAQIDSDPELLKEIESDPLRRQELLNGHPGESYWHAMPKELKEEWSAHVAQYSKPEYGEDPSTFDGPCIWLDMETRQCKNHEFRPRICRDFETGSPECLEWRSYYRDKIELNSPDEN
jgi:Fe-S-cluster containining protein